MTLADRVAAVQARIAGAVPPGASAPRLMAVTKRVDVATMSAALDLGIDLLGESYVAEWIDKAPAFSLARRGGVEVHLIGQLQTNKVRKLVDGDGAPLVDAIQSVDRPSLIASLARWCPTVPVMVQVDLASAVSHGVAGRGGCLIDDVPSMVDRASTAGLHVVGLMGIAPNVEPNVRREAFDRLVGAATDLGLPVRSIGMSSDLEEAVAAGSTMVRLGSDLFGARA